MHNVEYIIDSYDSRDDRQFCVQIFVVDIEFQDMIHEGSKLSVLYCDVTKTELQKTFQKEDRTL